MSLPWFRMYSEFAGDPIVQALSFEDQRHYVMILCLKCDGVLDRKIAPRVRPSIIARALGVTADELSEISDRLIEFGLIDETFQPCGWDKRQYKSDDVTARTRKHRSEKAQKKPRKPLIEKDSVNVPETGEKRSRNAPDTDTDTDIKKIDPGASARAESEPPPGIPANIDRTAWHEYVGHLHGLGKNQNPGLLQRNAALLAEYPADIQREIVDTTIRNGWTGLFKPKTTTTTTGPAPGKLARAREALLNDPELARYVSGDDDEGAVVPVIAQLGFGPGGR